MQVQEIVKYILEEYEDCEEDVLDALEEVTHNTYINKHNIELGLDVDEDDIIDWVNSHTEYSVVDGKEDVNDDACDSPKDMAVWLTTSADGPGFLRELLYECSGLGHHYNLRQVLEKIGNDLGEAS